MVLVILRALAVCSCLSIRHSVSSIFATSQSRLLPENGVHFL